MKINRVMLVFLLLLSIIFSGCRSSEPKSGENAPNSVITGELPDPASAAIAETQSFDEENSLLQILHNQVPFYSVSNQKSVTLEEYCASESERMGFTVSIFQYTFVDMDNDGIQEAVVDFCFGENNQVMCIVLKWGSNSETVFGTEFYYRQMSQIKEDGTFAYSGGGDNDGWAKLRWENDSWVIETVEDSSQKSDVQWYSYPVIVLPLNCA